MKDFFFLLLLARCLTFQIDFTTKLATTERYRGMDMLQSKAAASDLYSIKILCQISDNLCETTFSAKITSNKAHTQKKLHSFAST